MKHKQVGKAKAAWEVTGPMASANLTERLRRRLDSVAREVPYARVVARKLGGGRAADLAGIDPRLADVLVDAMLLGAIKGNGPLIREMWARLEGRPQTVDSAGEQPAPVRTDMPGQTTMPNGGEH